MSTSLIQSSTTIDERFLSPTQHRLLRHAEVIRVESERITKGSVILTEFLRSLVSGYRPPAGMDGVMPSYRTPLTPVFQYNGPAVNGVIGDYLDNSISMLAYCRRQQQILLALMQALQAGGDGSGVNLEALADRVTNLEGEVVFLDGQIDGQAEDRDFVSEFNAALNS